MYQAGPPRRVSVTVQQRLHSFRQSFHHRRERMVSTHNRTYPSCSHVTPRHVTGCGYLSTSNGVGFANGSISRPFPSPGPGVMMMTCPLHRWFCTPRHPCSCASPSIFRKDTDSRVSSGGRSPPKVSYRTRWYLSPKDAFARENDWCASILAPCGASAVEAVRYPPEGGLCMCE